MNAHLRVWVGYAWVKGKIAASKIWVVV
jgi:hypothetical protein